MRVEKERRSKPSCFGDLLNGSSEVGLIENNGNSSPKPGKTAAVVGGGEIVSAEGGRSARRAWGGEGKGGVNRLLGGDCGGDCGRFGGDGRRTKYDVSF